jgi:hypothetical protein
MRVALLAAFLFPALALADVTVNGNVSVISLDGGFRLYDENAEGLDFVEGRIDTGRDTPLFNDRFVGSAVAAHNKWQQSLTTLAIGVGAGALSLNNSNVTSANSYATLTTVPKFRGFVDGALVVRSRARPVNLPATNALAELGLGNALTNATPTDGAFFRWTNSGGFECVVNRGGVETSANMTAPAGNVYSVFVIRVWGTRAECVVETPSSGFTQRIVVTLDSGAPSAFNESPGGMARVVIGASSPALAPRLDLGTFEVMKKVVDEGRSVNTTSALAGQSVAYVPTTGAQAANHANSAAPASATLSNTAAGYTTLGGRWQFAAPAGAVTDFALFGFQVPTSYRFVITGISISACNTGAAVATTATALEWSLGVGSTAVSLATTDATGGSPTSAPRRIPLGKQQFPIGAAIENCTTDVVRAFASPITVESGRFVHLILAVPVGTATASQVIRGTATFDGYFEQ